MIYPLIIHILVAEKSSKFLTKSGVNMPQAWFALIAATNTLNG
jgi:hypothetical protein